MSEYKPSEYTDNFDQLNTAHITTNQENLLPSNSAPYTSQKSAGPSDQLYSLFSSCPEFQNAPGSDVEVIVLTPKTQDNATVNGKTARLLSENDFIEPVARIKDANETIDVYEVVVKPKSMQRTKTRKKNSKKVLTNSGMCCLIFAIIMLLTFTIVFLIIIFLMVTDDA